MENKDTLNLPQTSLAMRANAAMREVEIQRFWEENNIYEKSLLNKPKDNKFILHDGPPYLSSDKIHIGTALNKILKDILVKYKSQRGFYAPYVPGYDAHGLPIENAVVKKIKGGRAAVSPYELRQKCREFALTNLKGQENNFKRLGVWGNWEKPYLTIKPDYEAEQIRVFGEMYKNGLIEKGLKPVYWCASCETALAEAEVEYQDHTSTAIYVRFEFVDAEEVYKKADISSKNPLYAVIWTTTPWTIPSNKAITVHPDFKYIIFDYKGENYIVEEELLKSFTKELSWENIKPLGSMYGRELELIGTKHPMCDRISKIILGEHVTQDAGTGAVHTAPGHGLEDYEVCMKYNIPVFSPFDSKGVWTNECPDFEGIPYYKGNSLVIEKLEEKGALLEKNEITHSYPHCWRCKNPVMYRATPQWFVKVDKFRKDALKCIDGVDWIPSSGKSRISKMVENRSDWCISRQRAWGVPIPVFYCRNCEEVIVTDETIEHVAKIFEKESSDAWVKHEEKYLLPEGFVCPKCSKTHFKKETDIMDVWFDSGVSWRAVVEKRCEELGNTPVEMYLEGSDQHRGWFQSSLLTSVATEGKAPYETVLTHGFVLDGEGRKMSKSLGNTILPQDIIKLYGADVLRLWAASVDYRNDIKIGDTIIKQLVEIFKKTRNTARFLLGNLYDFDPALDYVPLEKLEEIDRFALNRLNTLIANVTDAFDKYEFYRYFQYLQNFAAVDLSAFYLDIVKDRLYVKPKKSLSRRACQSVIYEILHTLIRILVPVMPHQAEDIWLNMPEALQVEPYSLYGESKGEYVNVQSALLTAWPEQNPNWENKELEDDFTELLKLREMVTRAIEPLRSSKQIGSALETAIYFETQDKTKNPMSILKKYRHILADLFIVSQVHVAQDPRDPSKLDSNEEVEHFLLSQKDLTPTELLGEHKEGLYKITICRAKGQKCERCWKYRDLTDGLCSECRHALEQPVLK